MNLLEETKALMDKNKKTGEDILWIGSEDGVYSMTWKEFEKVADFEYDNSWGAAEVATDLIIMFMDGSYMTRGEYDGSEWWDYHDSKMFKQVPIQNRKQITNLGGKYRSLWESIETMNTPKEENKK